MVFDEITKRGLRPSVVNFKALINWYCRRGKPEEGLRLKKVMEESWRCTPDVYTYSASISRLCKQSKLDGARQLLEEMCERGLVPNEHLFTSLIDAYCNYGRVDMAMKIYRMMLSKGTRPHFGFYDTLSWRFE